MSPRKLDGRNPHPRPADRVPAAGDVVVVPALAGRRGEIKQVHADGSLSIRLAPSKRFPFEEFLHYYPAGAVTYAVPVTFEDFLRGVDTDRDPDLPF